MSEFTYLEGEYDVIFHEGHPLPAGVIMPGDCQGLRGKVIRLTSPRGKQTIHLITDAHYEEGSTVLSFDLEI